MFRFFKKIFINLTVFFLAVFFSFCLFVLVMNPIRPVFFLGEKLAAVTGVGNTASVPSNPVNRLAMQLEQKEKELNDRERFLDDKVLSIERENSLWRNRLMLGVFLFLIVLFVLVVFNFYFDSKRAKALKELKKE